MKNVLDRSSRHWWLALVLILVAAAVLRLCNLGSFSLWLDEVVTVEWGALPLSKLLAASAGDAENVPVYLIVAHLAQGFGLGEPWIRLPSILAGLGSIFLLMVWTRRRFCDGVALATGVVCALSTFHIRYSQELRAYPFLLLVVGLTLLAGDRLRRRPDSAATAALSACVALGLYTHLTYPLALVPLVGSVLAPDRGYPRGASAAFTAQRLALAIALGVASFLPWFFLITNKLGERIVRNVRGWTLDVVADRWHFLTVAPYERSPIGWLGIVIAGIALIGVAAGWRRSAGRFVVLCSVPTLVAWEVVLATVGHWSDGRYSTVLWPFLAVIVGIGIHTVMSMLRWPWARASVGVLLSVAVFAQVNSYHRIGRPSWDALARAIELVQRPGERVFAVNTESQLCVGHYLEAPIATADAGAEAIKRCLRRQPSLLLVYGGWPGSPDLRRLARRQTLLLHVNQPPRDAYLYRISADFVNPNRLMPAVDSPEPVPWPQPAAELLPSWLQQPRRGCLARALPGRKRQASAPDVYIEAGRFADMGSGWSPLVTRPDGTTYRWTIGREASLELPGREAVDAMIRFRLRPPPELAGWQRLRLTLNGRELDRVALHAGYQNVTTRAPPTAWQPDANLLVLQFRGALPNPEARSPWEGPPPRAAAIDWVEVSPQPP